MPEPTLLREDRGAVRVLTLNRPDKRNALNTELTRAIGDQLLAADGDPAVRAIVLAGAGQAFCAGADLTEFGSLTPDAPQAVHDRADLTTTTQMLPQSLSTPVVAVVQGAAMGGGAGLALACDMLVAATDLRLGYPEMRHSIVPSIVMTGLTRHVGRKLAFELVSTGRTLTAQEALEHGLANRVVPIDDALTVGLEIAESWAEKNVLAMATTKRLFYRVTELPFADAMAAGRDTNVIMRSFRETT